MKPKDRFHQKISINLFLAYLTLFIVEERVLEKEKIGPKLKILVA